MQQQTVKCGILEKDFRTCFEKINGRSICKERCWHERKDFREKDKKGHESRSNLIVGFSSERITLPVDILIVGEAHGGGRAEDFRKQEKLDYEVLQIAEYYRYVPDKTFHQQQVRILLEILDKMGKTWVFTDLVKCFVWRGRKGHLDGRTNWQKAIECCSEYLEEQIEFLKPRKILGLGDAVTQYFKTHGHKSMYIGSLFPSRWTADLWVARKGWEPIIAKL